MEEVFRETIVEARTAGRTVLLSSHVLAEVEALCDRVSTVRPARTSITAELDRVPDLGSLPGVHDVTADGHRVHCEVDTASLTPVLRALTAAGVRSLVSRPPTLEELFLRHYGDELREPAGVAS